jgi:hypothetical protein
MATRFNRPMTWCWNGVVALEWSRGSGMQLVQRHLFHSAPNFNTLLRTILLFSLLQLGFYSRAVHAFIAGFLMMEAEGVILDTESSNVSPSDESQARLDRSKSIIDDMSK